MAFIKCTQKIIKFGIFHVRWGFVLNWCHHIQTAFIHHHCLKSNRIKCENRIRRKRFGDTSQTRAPTKTKSIYFAIDLLSIFVFNNGIDFFYFFRLIVYVCSFFYSTVLKLNERNDIINWFAPSLRTHSHCENANCASISTKRHPQTR